MTRGEKVAFLTEHLCYELLMLRYCLKQIVGEEKQLVYNMAYEAFAVHAQLLYLFLTNGDSGNAQVKDFDRPSGAKKTELTINHFQALINQVLHLGRKRPSEDDEKKVTLPQVQDVADWIEQQFAEFLNSLDQDLQSGWKPDAADPDNVEPKVLTFGPVGPQGQVRSFTGPSATNVVLSTSSKPTASNVTTADRFISPRAPPKVDD